MLRVNLVSKLPRVALVGLSLPRLASTMTTRVPPGTPEHQLYTGKEHKWANNPLTRVNNGLRSLTPTFALLFMTIVINRSTTGQSAYKWLNANYSPFQINAWWTFGITSVVYWIGGLIFMVFDLTERPRRVFKYKLQTSQKVCAQDYGRICWIVLRNQVRFSCFTDRLCRES